MQCSEIMKAQPECVDPDVTAADAAERMREKNIGFLPVCDSSGAPIGTITDRDIAVRVVARRLAPATAVGDVMTRDVVACRTTDDVERAKVLMAQHQKSRIMCIDDAGRVAGVISLSDIAQREDAAATLRDVSAREAHP